MPLAIPSRRAPFALALAATACACLAAAPAAPAAARPPKCKHGKIVVRLNKKRVCQRTASLFPTPKPGDVRVAFVKYALAPRTSKVAGRRGRHVRSFSSFGKPAKKARASILRLLPKVLSQVDAAQGARAAAASGGRVPRAGPCVAPEKPNTYTSHDGNSTRTASQDADGMTIGFDGTTSTGITIHFPYVTDGGCAPLTVPPCPQASGEVDAQSTKAD